jgi:Tol biopolymer transport system component
MTAIPSDSLHVLISFIRHTYTPHGIYELRFFSTSGTLLLASVLLGVGLSLSGCDSTGSNAEGNEEDEETVTVDSPLLYAEVNTDLEGTVYTVQADGSNRSEVADSIDTGIARWADSRSTVVYTRGSTLYRVNPDGTEKEIILDREAGFFQMDASSDQIAFTLDGERGIYVVGLDGTGLAKVVDRRISNVRLSPDGSRILFNDSSSEDQDLFTVPVDGSASPTRLTSGMEAEQFTWSPDGSDVLFRDDSSGNLYRGPSRRVV